MLTCNEIHYYSAVHGVSTSFDYGELIGIVGPNGAGKSTFVKILAGVVKPEFGYVQFDNVRIDSLSSTERARNLAYLPQHIPDDIAFSVEEFVAMGRFVYKQMWSMKRNRIQEMNKVREAITRFDLTAIKDKAMEQISGGERQRAAIARCFAQGAKILILDEPISNLDLFYQIQILTLLEALAKEGYMVIVVLHNLELAARYCSRLLVFDKGSIYQAGMPKDVLTPATIRNVFRIDVKPYTDPYQEYLRFSIF